MAEKIYPASQQKRKKEREKGNVAKSNDIITLATLFVSLSFIYMQKEKIFNLMNKYFVILKTNINNEFNLSILNQFIGPLILFILPLLVITAITGFMANYLQVGLKFSPKVLAPDIKKINPINGFKKMFSKDTMIELVKSLLKVIGVLYISMSEIKTVMLNIQYTYTTNANMAFNYIFESLFSIVMKIAMLLIGVSIIDFGYKKYKFEKDLMMTREEMMEEYKQTEGNPHTKSRQKELARMLTKKQIQKVKEATVLITNPTHFAVAIKYDMNEDLAPIVLFKGVDEVALAAKKLANENKIPMVENKPLARALYAQANEGDYIPETLWVAVAQVISEIYALNDNINKK